MASLRLNSSNHKVSGERIMNGDHETDKSSLLMDHTLSPTLVDHHHDIKMDSIMGRKPYADIGH